MTGIESLFNTLPGHWAIIALIAGIGLSVVFLRGLIRLLVRAFIIGIIGVILLGAVYYLFNFTNFSL
jgi:hypothetical protein